MKAAPLYLPATNVFSAYAKGGDAGLVAKMESLKNAIVLSMNNMKKAAQPPFRSFCPFRPKKQPIKSRIPASPVISHSAIRIPHFLAALCLLLSALQPLSPSAFSSSYLVTPVAGIRDLEGASVYKALQTRDGYLWLSTAVGLVRFDGLNPVTYRPGNTPAFSTTVIHCLHQARNEDLWIGTEQGVVRRRHDTFERIPGLDNIGIHAFAEDASGAIWIGTHGQGLYSWRDGALRHHPQQLLATGAEHINALCIDSAGTLWIGSRATGVITLPNASAFSGENPPPGQPRTRRDRVDRADQSDLSDLSDQSDQSDQSDLSDHSDHSAFRIAAIGAGNVSAIAEHPRGTHWFGTHAMGLYRLTPDGAIAHYTTRHGLATLQVSQITPAADGGLWLTSGNLHKIPPDGLLAPPAPGAFPATIATFPETQPIDAFTEDHEGSIWLCARTSIGGLLRARAIRHQLISVAQGLPGDNIKTISRDPAGNLWLTVRNGGIVKLAPDGAITRLPIPPGMEDATPHNSPDTAIATSDGAIWSIWQGRVFIWRDNHHAPVPVNDDACGLHEDTAGRVWISCDKHTERRDKNGLLLDTPADAPLRAIRRGIAFHETPDGALYIASKEHGLYKYHRGALTTHDTTNGLPGNKTRAVYVDSRGNLWLGLREHGIATLGEDGRWRHSDALSAALADKVSAITEDSRGNLWLGTAAGVLWSPIDALLDSIRAGAPVQDLHSLAIASDFQAAPVWSGDAPVHAWLPDGRLLFATRAGILAFNPLQAAFIATPPPVHIEKVIADGRPLDMRPRPARIPAGTRSLTIECTGLSYIRPDSIVFRYRLGNQAPWQDIGTSHRIIFADISPGNYQLQVTARTASGVWNPAPATLHFTVAPFFWQTLWFRIALPVALLAAFTLSILSIHRARTRRLQRRAADLARQNTELEARVQERTLELALSNTAKSEFLENISHEIRNPLNGITGLIGQIDDGHGVPLTPAQRAHAHALKASARQLNRVFEEILGFSKLEYGYVTTHETRFSPSALLAEIRDLHTPQADALGGSITLRLPPEERHYTGDEAKIRTIIDNFVTNALKYAPGTPVTITLTVAESAPAARTDQSDQSDQPDQSDRSDQSEQAAFSEILIEVTDCGPGVPRDEQELIFKKFARGSIARQSGVSGTGIGLATCAATARHLGGNVGIDSQPGQGATFFLKLPLLPAPDNNNNAAACARPPPGPATRDAAPVENREPKIENPAALIVDDQGYNQIVLAALIARHGIRPDCAATAAEALAKIETRPAGHPYDIIFLDIGLPDMQGTQLARLIRARPDGARPALIGVSAHDSDEIRSRCLAAGMNDFFLKPLSEDTLMAAVARHGIFSIPDSRFSIGRCRAGATPGAVAPSIENRKSKIENSLDLSPLELYATRRPGGMAAARRVYIDTLRAELAAAQSAHAAGNTPALALAAHRVVSHATLVGALGLGETATRLETRALRGENGPLVAPLLADLETRAETLIAQLPE